MVLDSDLHACYLVTPLDGQIPLDCQILRRLLVKFNDAERRVCDLVGVQQHLVDQGCFSG